MRIWSRDAPLGQRIVFVVLVFLAVIVAIVRLTPSSDTPSAAATPSTAASPEPVVPPMNPKDATITIAAAFTMGTTDLGDPQEKEVVDVTTNIPVAAFLGTIDVTGGGLCSEGGQRDRCRFVGGSWRAEGTCTPHCARSVSVSVLVCSYSDDPFGAGNTTCGQQTDTYIAWVGQRGANLVGNPLAVHDADHPAVLNLRKTQAFANP